MLKNFLGWLVIFFAIFSLIHLADDGRWLALFITVTVAAFCVAALEYLFGGNRGKHHL